MVDLFTSTDDLSGLEPVQLHALYRELQATGATRDLSDEELFRACAIMRALRRKSSGPPAAKRPPKTPRSTIVADTDSL